MEAAPQESAQIIIDMLNGTQDPKTDIILLNAGAAICLDSKAEIISEGT